MPGKQSVSRIYESNTITLIIIIFCIIMSAYFSATETNRCADFLGGVAEKYCEGIAGEICHVFGTALTYLYGSADTCQLSHTHPDTEVLTVGGWMMERLGKVPLQGNWFEYEHRKFAVEKMTDKRIEKVRLIFQDQEKGGIKAAGG